MNISIHSSYLLQLAQPSYRLGLGHVGYVAVISDQKLKVLGCQAALKKLVFMEMIA